MNKRWCKGFAVGKATHKEVKKSESQLKFERDKKKRIADIEERIMLKDFGFYNPV
jgi:hypothetical protein